MLGRDVPRVLRPSVIWGAVYTATDSGFVPELRPYSADKKQLLGGGENWKGKDSSLTPLFLFPP